MEEKDAEIVRQNKFILQLMARIQALNPTFPSFNATGLLPPALSNRNRRALPTDLEAGKEGRRVGG
jgi:hypothetical protein